MLKFLSSRLLWGLVLIIGGVLLLLDTFNVFKGGALFWTILSAAAGVLFLSVYFASRIQWWALIPGTIFLAVAALIGLDAFLPGFSGSDLEGVVILGGIALAFLFVYLADRRNWWAIIPFGVMATLALISWLSNVVSGEATGGVLFVGFGLTFALVALLPNPVGQMRWAWIPAGILGVFGIVLLLAAQAYLNYIWPAILVILGLVLIIRSVVRRA